MSEFEQTWLLDSAQIRVDTVTTLSMLFSYAKSKSLTRSFSAIVGPVRVKLLGTKQCAKKRILHTKRVPLFRRSKLQTGLFEMDPQIGLGSLFHIAGISCDNLLRLSLLNFCLPHRQ